ncbi:low molecular weight protein-tyrosine-phosphatase [Lacihabitans soyangensis]|uniref:protein-tyrosine-phosphatase n=1 Tax=Lacihabitans soyangensis TaxID=869394 RepID=A0AAE3H956_9BACT|nr:low molecular weight protein-tyrosine-phosphatase [Lacihabitans soyangensis]MCP9765825.1 low molecular weight phosphotyrosine protein phosphatase [Lacihabitans soyangensis]
MRKVLFVCLGNICRSPIGEATFNKIAQEKGLSDVLWADSAGVMGWHVGKKADPRTIKNAAKHDIEITHLGRKLSKEDLDAFEHIVVMDEQNFEDVHKFYYDTKKTPPSAEKLFLIRDFDPTVRGVHDVKDPYYEGEEVFEEVFQTLWRSNEAFINHLVEKHDLQPKASD